MHDEPADCSFTIGLIHEMYKHFRFHALTHTRIGL